MPHNGWFKLLKRTERIAKWYRYNSPVETSVLSSSKRRILLVLNGRLQAVRELKEY